MHQKQPAKPLSTKAIKAMKPNSKDRSDTGENTGLRVFVAQQALRHFSTIREAQLPKGTLIWSDISQLNDVVQA